jgi:hypothetical protein
MTLVTHCSLQNMQDNVIALGESKEQITASVEQQGSRHSASTQ